METFAKEFDDKNTRKFTINNSMTNIKQKIELKYKAAE